MRHMTVIYPVASNLSTRLLSDLVDNAFVCTLHIHCGIVTWIHLSHGLHTECSNEKSEWRASFGFDELRYFDYRPQSVPLGLDGATCQVRHGDNEHVDYHQKICSHFFDLAERTVAHEENLFFCRNNPPRKGLLRAATVRVRQHLPFMRIFLAVQGEKMSYLSTPSTKQK